MAPVIRVESDWDTPQAKTVNIPPNEQNIEKRISKDLRRKEGTKTVLAQVGTHFVYPINNSLLTTLHCTSKRIYFPSRLKISHMMILNDCVIILGLMA